MKRDGGTTDSCGERIVDSSEREKLGLDMGITRRDFVGSTLLGTGSALLAMAAPSVGRGAPQTISAPLNAFGPEWTGPGGIGDYARSNGNTHEVVNAAHAGIRNRQFQRRLQSASDTGEQYDVVVVGCGISGLTAGYAFHKTRPEARILMLDTHPAFGGEAKHNEFEVDGYRLWAPQGSGVTTQTSTPQIPQGYDLSDGFNIKDLYFELGFPERWEFAKPEGLTKKDLLIGSNPWGSMLGYGDLADTGYFYSSKGWVINPWSNGFRDAPISQKMREDLFTWRNFNRPPYRSDWRQWLDSMTLLDYMTKVMGLSPEFHEQISPFIGVTSGLGADATSAYGALGAAVWQHFDTFERSLTKQPSVPPEGVCPSALGPKHCPYPAGVADMGDYVTLPGGNSAVARQLVRRLIPAAFSGSTMSDVLLGSLNWDTLDRAGESVRMRLSSTVLDVTHEGAPGSSKGVWVTYLRGGKLFRVRAKSVVMAGQQHVNKTVCSDLPEAHRAAMDAFAHGPVLTVNVALRHWKFLDRLGISAARWFEGFGWFTSINRSVLVDGRQPMPLDPAKPIVLTLYMGFGMPGLPYKQQATAARMRLFGMSFADIEAAVRNQFNTMFGSAGFDARRDIAGIITNRWGHAYAVEQPGFYFGTNGQPAPSNVIRRPHDRVSFCHAELCGTQTWLAASLEGSRAAKQALDVA